MAGQPIKIMYFGPRPQGRTPEAFRERWRRHGHLAMTLPLWDFHTHYEQFDVLSAGEEGLTSELAEISRSDVYGGVGQIWIRDADALDEMLTDAEGVATMATDEIETFGGELGDALVPTTEHVVLDRGQGALALINRLQRRPEVPRAEFSARWRALGAEVVATPELARHVTRYVQSHATPQATGADGYVQLEFASAQALGAFLAEPVLTEHIQPAEAAFLDMSRMDIVLARRTVLYDRPSGFTTLPATAGA